MQIRSVSPNFPNGSPTSINSTEDCQSAVKTWVKPPTTQPWGTRSIYFRDPDSNLVDFYTPPNRRREGGLLRPP